MILYRCFFSFKQKTAYEMRISDWSSDVCSSDLEGGRAFRTRTSSPPGVTGPHNCASIMTRIACLSSAFAKSPEAPARRSEEHTSELQSLMRISYAVFCLKKKKTAQIHSTSRNYTTSRSKLT